MKKTDNPTIKPGPSTTTNPLDQEPGTSKSNTESDLSKLLDDQSDEFFTHFLEDEVFEEKLSSTKKEKEIQHDPCFSMSASSAKKVKTTTIVPAEATCTASQVSSQVSSQAHTTEWLRSQLEKMNKECSELREKIFTKEGETKILRNRLHELNLEFGRQQTASELERKTLKIGLEAKINSLQKQLELCKTQIMISTGETRSRMLNLGQTKKVEPEFLSSATPSKSFKQIFAEKEKASRSFSELSQKKNLKTIDSQSDISKEPTAHSVVQNEATMSAFQMKANSISKMLSQTRKLEALHIGDELKCIIVPHIFEESQPEFSFLVPPHIDYYPFNILYRDVSEIPINEDTSVLKQLKTMWNIQSWKIEEQGPERMPIKRSRYFTSLKSLHPVLDELCRLPKWNSNFHIFIIQHITKMARELYVALRDSAVMSDTTIHKRENEIIDECLDTSELKEDFNLFCSKKWKREIFVDLRRGISLISAISDLDKKVAVHVLQESGFLGSQEDVKKIRNTRKPPKCIGSWFDGEQFLNAPAHMILKTLKSPDVKTIHSQDSFGGCRLEVGPVTTLLHKLSVEECRTWEQRLTNQKFEMQSASKKFFDDLFCQLESMRRNISCYGDMSCQPSPALVGLEACSDNEDDDNDLQEEELEEEESVDDSMETEFQDSEEKVHYVELQAQEYWLKIESAVDPPKREANIESKMSQSSSLMRTIIEREEMKWVSQHLGKLSIKSDDTASSALERMSSSSCISEVERELLSSAFHNFLKIRSNVMGEEYLCLCQFSGGKNEHGLFDKSEHEEGMRSKKRKIDLNASTSTVSSGGSALNLSLMSSSTSSSSSSGGSRSADFKFVHKKYDLAPLKKSLTLKAVGLSKMEEMDIVEEVNKIYEKNSAQAAKSLKSSASTSKNTGETVLIEERKNQPITVQAPDKTPEERAVECELLDILLEVIKRIGLMRFTPNFNALFVAIIKLIQSTMKVEVPVSLFRPQKIYTLVLEILYCRPSPIVLRSVNELLVQIIQIRGFAKLLCHNAQPNIFFTHRERISFKRGACLLSTICTLVEFSAREDNWEIQFQLFRWLAYLMQAERPVIDDLYEKQRTSSLRCHCVMILNNTVMTILCKGAAHYYKCCIEHKLSPLLKCQLTEIIEHGIRMVAVIVEIDKFFGKNTYKHCESFFLFLETITFMHNPSQNQFDIQLQERDLIVVKQLLEEATMARKRKKEIRGGPKDLAHARDIFTSMEGVSVPYEMFALVPKSDSSKLFLDSDED